MLIGVHGHSAAVDIDVEGYQYVDAKTFEDANWLSCLVDIRLDGFSSRFRASYTTHDFLAFHEGLVRALTTLEGSASFQPYDESLTMNVVFTSHGNAAIAGVARRADGPRVELTFYLDSDQSYLTQTAAQLGRVLREYPSRLVGQ